MAFMSRPFWQTLVAADSGENLALTCDECFAILEYLAEEAAEPSADRVAATDASVGSTRANAGKCPP